MRSTSRLLLAGTLIALSLIARPGEALVRVDNKIHTGIFTLTATETVRIHVHHIPGRGARCDVRLFVFRAATGQQIASGSLSLQGGDGNFFGYSEPQPAQLRIVVELVPPAAGQRNGNCVVSGEVGEDVDGPTHYVLGNAAQFTIVTGP